MRIGMIDVLLLLVGAMGMLFAQPTSSGACATTPNSPSLSTDWTSVIVAVDSTAGQRESSVEFITNMPWVVHLSTTDSLPPAYRADGAVRTGANSWTTGSIWSCGTQGCPITTSTAMSPSDAYSPMAYTVIGWWGVDPSTGFPSGYSYATLVAWDLNNGSIRTLLTQVVDQVYIADSSYEMTPSIAVSGHSGYDTLHICYVYRDGSADRIYYRKNGSALNPSIIRGGGSITWGSRIAVSTSGSQPAGEPSIEYYSASGVKKSVVRWSAGSGARETYGSCRPIGSSYFSAPWNLTGTTRDWGR